ncbi:MAG: imidazolonepropionase, partial [Muribaculaceae bacterium]|nr:imidazolonepropionase [Muribaculaceae bacterium]
MMGNLKIHNVTIVTPVGHEAVKGERMGHLRVIPKGCIIITGGKISYADREEGAPATRPDEHYEEIDGHGNVALPGFVDSHTHLIFGGFRPDEFSWRLNG